MNRVSFARLLSLIGHPFAFIALLVIMPFWAGGQTGSLRVVAVVIAIGVIPLILFTRQRFISGRWESIDASGRNERPTLLAASIALMLPISFYFYYFVKSMDLLRGITVVALMLLVAGLINRWIKPSLHLAFAAFAAILMSKVRVADGVMIGLFIPFLAWSRLALLRHTIRELIGGLALGAVSATVLLSFYY